MPTPTLRILIADDEPLFLKTTGELLAKAGYECICVADAGAALDSLGRERFDLLLSDLNMPGNAQLELLREGRARWPEVPLIVITGVPSLPTARARTCVPCGTIAFSSAAVAIVSNFLS